MCVCVCECVCVCVLTHVQVLHVREQLAAHNSVLCNQLTAAYLGWFMSVFPLKHGLPSLQLSLEGQQLTLQTCKATVSHPDTHTLK